jgi:hypothetical protein
MAFRSARAISSIVVVAFRALLALGTSSYAQQTTGQLLISSGFNPIAASAAEIMGRLMSFQVNSLAYGNSLVLRLRGSIGMHLCLRRQPDCHAQASCEFWRVACGHAFRRHYEHLVWFLSRNTL